jgi:hypothetical protein
MIYHTRDEHANDEDEAETKTDKRSGMNAKELLNNNKLGTEEDPLALSTSTLAESVSFTSDVSSFIFDS